MLGDLINSAVKCDERKSILSEKRSRDKVSRCLSEDSNHSAVKIVPCIMSRIPSPLKEDQLDFYMFNLSNQEFES